MAKIKELTLADELEQNLYQQEELQIILKPLKEKEDAIRAELVTSMLKKGLKFIRTESGLAFGITPGRVTFKVKPGKEQEAIVWAQENYPSILSLASAKLNSVVKPMLKIPAFLDRVEGESFLSVRTQETE